MKYITNIRYEMEMGCCLDIWGIHGEVRNRYLFITSKPVSFDREKRIFTVKSGSVYQIMSFACPEEKFWKDLQKDIDSNGNS